MKNLYLSVTLLAASASCSAMHKQKVLTKADPVSQVKAYCDDTRKREVEFSLENVTLNDAKTHYTDEAFLEVVDSILEITQQRYDYLLKLWEETSHNQDYQWFFLMGDNCLNEMKFLKECFMRKLYDNLLMQIAFEKDQQRTYTLFVDVLNLFEKFHDLRIDVCRAWPKGHKPWLVSQVYLGKSMEENFQIYANVLKADVTVNTWYERMRKNDI